MADFTCYPTGWDIKHLKSGRTVFPSSTDKFVEHSYWSTPKNRYLQIEKVITASQTFIDVLLGDVHSLSTILRIRNHDDANDEQNIEKCELRLVRDRSGTESGDILDDAFVLKNLDAEYTTEDKASFDDIVFDGFFVGILPNGGGEIHFTRKHCSVAILTIHVIPWSHTSKPLASVVQILKDYGNTKAYTSLEKHLASGT
jgi:hypothetical protein